MRPDYLIQGEIARLFPVLSTTSKEGRATSILLSCISKIDEFARELLRPLGASVGKRTSVQCWTEIVFKGEKEATKDRPDGLIVVTNGSKVWRALVEAKVGNVDLDIEQIERYRTIARDHQLDCVITISNLFASRPDHHPLEGVRKKQSKIPVFHWSWMSILTVADLLTKGGDIEDRDQHVLMEELIRFLTHESTGVRGFERMPPAWAELNRLVSAGGQISAKSSDALEVISAWHQETRDLVLILSRQTETSVSEKISRKNAKDPSERTREDFQLIRDKKILQTELEIPNAAASIRVVADLTRRCIDVGMTLAAPGDRQSSKARLSWLLRQIKGTPPEDLQVRCFWPKRSENTQFSFSSLVEDPSRIEENKKGLQVYAFEIFISRHLASRFTQQQNFIVDLERIVPEFYRDIGQHLTAWREKPPQIKSSREEASDVSVAAVNAEAETAAYSISSTSDER